MADLKKSNITMASLLIVGDLHYSERSAKIIPYLRKGINAAIDKYKPDGVVFLGDTLDRFRVIDSVWHGLATKFLIEVSLRVPILLLIGNHDIPNKNLFMSGKHGFKALRYFETITVADKAAVEFVVNGLKFVGVPYCPNGRFAEGLATYKGDLSNVAAIFCHQEFCGCNINGTPSKHGDSVNVNSPYHVSGHIHLRHKPQLNIRYPGSPYQDKSDEPLDKSISLMHFTAGEPYPTEELIYLDVPKKYRLKLDAKGYKNLVVCEKDIYVVTVTDFEAKLARWRTDEKTNLIVKHGGKVNFLASDTVTDEMLELFETIPTIESMVLAAIKDRPDLQEIHRLVYGNG